MLPEGFTVLVKRDDKTGIGLSGNKVDPKPWAVDHKPQTPNCEIRFLLTRNPKPLTLNYQVRKPRFLLTRNPKPLTLNYQVRKLRFLLTRNPKPLTLNYQVRKLRFLLTRNPKPLTLNYQVRKLRFLLAEAIELGSTCVITIGGVQSNHCRATAVASTKVMRTSLNPRPWTLASTYP
jgi:hypothetical protein